MLLGREAAVVFVRRVLNKQHEGLFRKSIPHFASPPFSQMNLQSQKFELFAGYTL